MGMTSVLFLLGFASMAYFFLYIFTTGNNNLFTYFWFILGMLLILAGILRRIMYLKNIVMPKRFKIILYTVMGIFFFIFIVTEAVIIKNSIQEPEADADYIIVLGARVNGTKVSRNLKYRLDAASGYYKDNPGCKIIVSGGQGMGEDITEGKAMKDYLVKQGINPGNIITEEKSANTDENLKYSMDIIKDKKASVVIVSNNFHIYRAKKIAEKQGYENVSGIGTWTVAFTIPNCYVREAFAVIKYKIFGQI